MVVRRLFERIREPGWPRRIAILVVLAIIMAIPYPLSITGEFEVISLRPMAVRNKVEAPLVQVGVKMGDRVQAGQVVAKLLDVELKLERDRVKAELAEAEAKLRLAERGFRSEEKAAARFRAEGLQAEATLAAKELQRATKLFRARDIPKAQLDQARAAYVQAKKNVQEAGQEVKKLQTGFREEEIAQAASRVDQLKGRVAEVEQRLAWTQLEAPIAGVVVTPDHELQRLIGAHVARGTAVMEIVSPDDLVARVEVPEREFGDVEVGQDVELRAFQYPTTSLDGTVATIEQQVTSANEFASVVPIIARVTDREWRQLRVHTRGRAKIDLGYSPIGYVLYRRLLRSTFVKIWSWY